MIQTHNNARILIVDDSPTAREMLSVLLEVEQYKLLYATSGQELLDNLDDLNPDVILLDVMMPGMDGFEICQHIREQAAWAHLPIILVTALDSQQDLARGLDAGADDFLHKPVNGIELRARVRSMLRIKRQFDALEAAIQLREDLAHMIVHDMRIPLTAIVGFTELLQMGYISNEDSEDIDNFRQQVLRLNALVNDILVQAKMEHGTLLLNRAPVEVNGLVQKVVNSHTPIAQSRGIDLVLELPAESPEYSLDADLFQRLLDNLLSNALKYSPEESTVTVQVTDSGPPAETLCLKVIDEGPGIPPQDRERIFNKYEIANLKHSGTSAIGLGLAFAKLVVEAHGGKIFVEANQPQGSIFVVEI